MAMTTTLTPAKIKAIAAGVRKGLTPTQAGVLAGIPRRTIEGWMQMAREGVENSSRSLGGDPKLIKLIPRLAHAVEEAEYGHRLSLLECVEDHSPKNWQAAAWILERKHGMVKPPDLVVHKLGEQAAERELEEALARRPTRVSGPDDK